MEASGPLSDHHLLTLLRKGDEGAFTILYNKYWRILYAHIYKMLRNEDEAKDILQEVFSSLWSRSAEIPEQQNFAGYLYIAARRKVLNAIRQQKFRNDYLDSLARYVTEASETTLQYLDERDLALAIEKEIQALPPRMRQVFEMSRKEHLSHKEIAERLGTSGETVKKQVNKSLRIIRTNLRESGGAAILLLTLLR